MKKIDNLNLYYNLNNNNLRYDKNFWDLEKYISLLENYLKENKSEKLLVVQVLASNLLDESIYRFRNENKKSIYMNKYENTIISKLDEKIFTEWIWYWRNENLQYTKEFYTKLDEQEQLQRKLLKDKFNYDNLFYSILDEYRKKMINKLWIKSDSELKDWCSERLKVDWKRKFEIPLKNSSKIIFDYRNDITSIYCIWNNTNWYSILWIGWWWSSFQRQTFTEMTYVLNKIIQKDNTNRFNQYSSILENELYYYNEFNELIFIDNYFNRFFINYDLWSNSTIFDNNKEDLNFIRWEYPHISFVSYFHDEEKSIYSWRNTNIDITLWLNKKEWLLYITDSIDDYDYIEDNKVKETILYFWDLENAYWDNWNDTPAIYNSWTPYSEFISKIVKFDFYIGDYFSRTDLMETQNMDYIKDNKLEFYSWIRYGASFNEIVTLLSKYWKPFKIY